MFFVHDYIGLFWIWNQFTEEDRGVSRGRSLWMLALVTCDTTRIKYIFFFYKKCQKVPKR